MGTVLLFLCCLGGWGRQNRPHVFSQIIQTYSQFL
jgi:hypothetical protein